ncbi:MAG: ABC transporter substrate-binding protein [Candidatus Aminicenantales bacterium]
MIRNRTIRLVLAAAILAALPLAGGPSRLSGGRTVTDSLGRTIAIPDRVEKILSLQPEITRIIVALGAGERLVGVDYFIRTHDHLFPIIYPEGRNLPAVSNTPEDMNFEMAMKLDPDIIFASPTELRMVDSLQDKMRIPVVALASMGSFEKLLGEMALVGRALDREERAASLIKSFRSRLDGVRRAVSPIPRERRPRVYLSFWGTLTRTPVSYEPVETAGGLNCAAGLLPAYLGTIATVVQVEQIVRWQPDIVLVQGNYPPAERSVSAESFLRDPRFRSLPAVRNGKVRYTFGFWYWWDPAEVLVETLYLADLFHPGAIGVFDLEKEGNAVFKEFYGIDGGFATLCRILACGGWDED